MKELFKKPYVYWMGGIFLVYMLLNIWLSKFYEVLFQIPYFLDTLNWSELLLSFILSLTIGILIAINMIFFIREYKKQKLLTKKQGFFTSLGMLGGFSTGVCSACISGFFPLIFGLFGIGFSWAFLPFNGVEIQFLSIGFLGINLMMITKKKSVCEVQQ